MGSWQDNIRKVIPYTPGEQPGRRDIIKLNTNENPYPPSEGVLSAFSKVDYEDLRRYPDTDATPLAQALCERYGVSFDNIFIGVGSDDVLGMAFLTFFNGKNPILFADITYSFYDVWAQLFNISCEKIPLDKNMCIVPEDYNRLNSGIVIANPNALTGTVLETAVIEEIIKNNRDSVVIVDEAYADFSGVSVVNLTEKYDNLLVVQTFSKSRALAGLRIGYAIGRKPLIDALKTVKNSYNSYTLSTPAIIAGTQAVKDDSYYKSTIKKIVDTRENFKKELSALGYTFPDSKANFVFATHKGKDIPKLFEVLRNDGIYVRHFDKPVLRDYLRITIGTDEQMEILINKLRMYT